jgi:hypothetical protein
MHYGIFFFPEGERVISQHTADKSFIVSKTPLLYEKQKGKSFIFLSYRGSNKPGVCDISTDKFFLIALQHSLLYILEQHF